MRHALRLHQDSNCAAATRIEVAVAWERHDRLVLSYVISGTIADIRLPQVAVPVRRDELWRHTCFEAFVGAASGSGYYELNFAPSREWAAYHFDDYRSGMRVAEEITVSDIDVQVRGDCCMLQAALAFDRDFPHETGWRLGLSAVIEEVSGRVSYWALAHPPGRPDFHHADGFALALAPALSS